MFKSQHKGMILPPQNCKLPRDNDKSDKELVSHLRIKASGCSYEECNKSLKAQFINGRNNKEIASEIAKQSLQSKILSGEM